MAARRKSTRPAGTPLPEGSSVHVTGSTVNMTVSPERTAASHPSNATPLEKFLIAAQKSLARSVRNAQQSAKTDNEFALGERPIYMIEGVDMEVSAAVLVESTEGRSSGERVMLDFDAPGDQRSRIRFRIASKPVELQKGAKLELANLDPLGEKKEIACLRVWLMDDLGLPVAGHPIQLHFARAGEKRAKLPITATTDVAGRVDFFVNTKENDVKIVGDRRRRTVFLRGGGRGVTADEYFVWATSERLPQWKVISPPPAPRPPILAAVAEAPPILCTEMYRLRIYKD
jgi:hypothetical protein